MDSALDTSTHDGFTVTDAAARRIQELITGEGNPKLKLRISVSGGGCSGFQYGITLDDKTGDDDKFFERNGVAVVIDETSFGLLGGAQINFVEDLMGASFQITNPNATSTCGCGSSFSA